jgi:hypothetical protein
MKIKWEKDLLEEIVKKSNSLKEALENIGLRSAGGNFKTIKKYLEIYNIDTSHFTQKWEVMVNKMRNSKIDLSLVLVENSTYSRTHLKNRLYEDGLKNRVCEICGQDENWNGMKISLILDHINGVYNDNRLENLRIVCPNCNAGLETHCGKNISRKKDIKKKSKVRLSRRKVERPSYEVLKAEIIKNGYSSTGRKYGVSDNAIRKWLKIYENELN